MEDSKKNKNNKNDDLNNNNHIEDENNSTSQQHEDKAEKIRILLITENTELTVGRVYFYNDEFDIMYLRDIFLEIMIYSDFQTIINCSKTCKLLNSLFKNEYLWKRKALIISEQLRKFSPGSAQKICQRFNTLTYDYHKNTTQLLPELSEHTPHLKQIGQLFAKYEKNLYSLCQDPTEFCFFPIYSTKPSLHRLVNNLDFSEGFSLCSHIYFDLLARLISKKDLKLAISFYSLAMIYSHAHCYDTNQSRVGQQYLKNDEKMSDFIQNNCQKELHKLRSLNIYCIPKKMATTKQKCQYSYIPNNTKDKSQQKKIEDYIFGEMETKKAEFTLLYYLLKFQEFYQGKVPNIHLVFLQKIKLEKCLCFLQLGDYIMAQKEFSQTMSTSTYLPQYSFIKSKLAVIHKDWREAFLTLYTYFCSEPNIEKKKKIFPQIVKYWNNLNNHPHPPFFFCIRCHQMFRNLQNSLNYQCIKNAKSTIMSHFSFEELRKEFEKNPDQILKEFKAIAIPEKSVHL